MNLEEFTHKNWQFTHVKRAIASQESLKNLPTSLPQLPEMLFLDSKLCLRHNDFQLSFTAAEALEAVKLEAPVFQVAAAECWLKGQNKSEIKDVIAPFDWTYTSEYEGSCASHWKRSESKFNMSILSQTDAPILFYAHLILYEDELADNGSAAFSVRVRVMSDCLLVLCRFFLRVDNVLFRIIDTRQVDSCLLPQEGGRVLKMHCGRECAYNEILKQVPMTSWGSKDLSVLTDEAWAARMVERFGSVISGDAEQVFESSF